MRRRIFLALILSLAPVALRASAQGVATQQQVPPDRVTVEEFKALRADGKVFVLDVRGGVDRKIKGAAHIPLDRLESRLTELPREREIVTYCS